MTVTFGPLLLDDEANLQLKPTFEPALRLYYVELWKDGAVLDVHGSGEWLETAAYAVDTVDAFLAEHDVRPLTAMERADLHGGLLQAKGGAGYEVLTRQIARRS
ncbi:hypothetical protein ACFYWO_39835 [Streptomyces sp. NPDC002932]|uniref:hypothetical protein n=1 Tax=Streptomyces sp. NPDC002932 TaxID=3364672 RepID=UPI0036A75896